MATLFGRYEYAGELGQGASGRVFAVHDLGEARGKRAIKVVTSDGGRLVWEFARLCQVSHPRLARVRELVRLEERAPAPFGLERGALLLVQDFVEGAPLSAAIAGDQRRALAARVGVAIAEALAALHEASLVHGDVKPDNVLCGPDGEGATLIDLGFARPPELSGVVRGTPAYMAPELFAGICTPAADVYALGALIYDVLRGDAAAAPSSSPGSPFRVRELDALELEPAAKRVLAQLLAADPARRPADGAAALALLMPVFHAPGREREVLRFASPRVTRTPREQADQVRTLPLVGHERALAALVGELEKPGMVAVGGPRGSGRSRLVREALRALQERRASEGQPVPTWVSSLPALALLRDVDAVLWLDQVRAEQLPEITRAASAATLSLRSLCVVLEGDLGVPRRVELGPLPDASFAALFARLGPKPALVAARAATHGLSGRLCALAAQLLLAQRDLADPRVWQDLDLGEATLERALPLATALAWLGTDLLPEHAVRMWGAEATQAAYDELRGARLLTQVDGALTLDPALARKLRASSDGPAVATLAQHVGVQPSTPFALLAAGLDASKALLSHARRLRREGKVDAACSLLADAAPYLDDPELIVLRADSERARGRYPEALALLGAHDPLLRAELLRLRGMPEARAELEALRDDHVRGARATALLARLAFDLGDLEGARAEAQAAAQGDREARARALEVEVLVCLARGELARAPVEALLQAARVGGQAPSFLARAEGRALALRSQVLSRRGDRGRAVADARAAVERARELGEAHEAATYALNLGLLELERGELGRALETLRDAAQRLASVARERDLARVLFNFAALALLIGDLERADVVLEEVERSLSPDPLMRAFSALLRADLLLARGALEAAERALDFEPPEGAQAWLYARKVQLALARGAPERAREALSKLRGLEGGDRAAALERETAELRLALAEGELTRAELCVQQNLPLLEPLPFADRLRFLLVAIEAARVPGHGAVLAERSALARSWLEGALASLPAELRATMRAVPAYARVLASEARAESPGDRPERWRELVRASRRLFAEPRETRLTARIAELALELVHAERALVIGFDLQGEPSVLARRELASDARGFSRSVLERVALEGRPLLTVEAGSDLRLERAQSVASLNVRSVLCAELRGLSGRAFLYLDDRLRPSAFAESDLALIEDLLELAQQALTVAQQRAREARRARRAELSQKRLTRELTRSLDVPPSVPTLIGASPALTRVTEGARRIARSDAPVLITGESGTGKELLARFVHDESPRKARSFVAESCAALPDSLLESALFGHVRGAFTGAERARRGLFEIADGGTLFLDEVGEMSALLQGKLLRVLQEGELRPLGSERTRAVDVRVIAATRQNLHELVRAGRFREDLYYRLAVVTLELPPLRERREDIPSLVEHFLHKHGEGRAIEPTAMRALELRDWPGNVRELENELRRGLALSDGELLLTHFTRSDPRDLEAPPSELDLHAHTERLTRKLVRDALALAEGNITRAAALLGISRFGLQKILKRLQLPAK